QIADAGGYEVALANIDARHPALPAGGPRQPGQQPDGGRFSGAVGPEKAENRAGGHVQVQPVQGAHLPVSLLQVLGPDGAHSSRPMMKYSSGPISSPSRMTNTHT